MQNAKNASENTSGNEIISNNSNLIRLSHWMNDKTRVDSGIFSAKQIYYQFGEEKTGMHF